MLNEENYDFSEIEVKVENELKHQNLNGWTIDFESNKTMKRLSHRRNSNKIHTQKKECSLIMVTLSKRIVKDCK